MQPTTGWAPNNANLHPVANPLLVGNVTVTFGFEAEFQCRHHNRVHDRKIVTAVEGERVHVNTRDFPFLMSTGNTEETGNWEVQSVPFTQLEACLGAMKTIKDTLRPSPTARSELRSFHLHMRFPLAITTTVEERNGLEGWISRVADAVLFWRVQHRSIEFALDNWTMQRNEVTNLTRRGTLRLDPNRAPGMWDCEIRGCMTSQAKIRQFTQIICTGLQRRDFTRIGHYAWQLLSTQPAQQQRLVDFFAQYGRADLTQQQRNLLQEMEQAATFEARGNIVLFGLNKAPYFSDVERASIEVANREFVENFIDFSAAGSRSRYLDALKQWAIRANIHHALLVTLTSGFGRSFGLEFELFARGALSFSAQRMAEQATLYRERNVPAVARSYSGNSFHLWQLKPDGSLKPTPESGPGAGYEMVSPVMAWDGALSAVAEALSVTRDLGVSVNTTCSLHVHIGLEAVTLEKLKTVCCNFLLFEPIFDAIVPEYRRRSAYCQSNLAAITEDAPNGDGRAWLRAAETLQQLCDRMNPLRPSPSNGQPARRYYKLNLQRVIGLRTLEFRQHEPTIDFVTARSWVELLVKFFDRDLVAPGTLPNDPTQRLLVLLQNVSAETREHFVARLGLYRAAGPQQLPVTFPPPPLTNVPHAYPPTPGLVIQDERGGSYLLRNELGRGGSSVVFECTYTSGGRNQLVALKLITCDRAEEESAAMREVRLEFFRDN